MRKVRFTTNFKETCCKHCQEGPGWVLQLELLKKRLSVVVDADAKAALVKEIGDCGKTIRLYELHLIQYAKQRAFLKELEKWLPVGHCIVYRDFVHQHNFPGSKVRNLVLVVLWRTVPGGELHILKLSHFCTDKKARSDQYFCAEELGVRARTYELGATS